MRCMILFLLVGTLQSFATLTYSQSVKFSLSMQNSTVKTVLTTIEQKSDFYFTYSVKEIEANREVSIDVKNKTVMEVLNALFANTDVHYVINDKHIALYKSNEAKSSSLRLIEQQQTGKHITGSVKDANGEPIIGANVVVKGSTNGVITDTDGQFSLNNVPQRGIIQISYIGYIPQEVVVSNQSVFDIILKEDLQNLDEVVVIGYGVVRKSDLTGAVGSIKASAIEKMPVARIDQAIQGRVSGVQVTSLNGAPGAATTIRIRGGNSINAGNEPLYVIDGVIGAGDLNTINPADIESIEILKDASSTAIYGSRGANGVILVTTKRGEGTDGVRLSYNGYYGIQSPTKQLDLLNGQEAAAFQNEFAAYNGNAQPFKDLSAISNTNWQDYIFRNNAPITDHNLSVSKASKDGNYFLSLNYFDQSGTMYKSNFERYQLRFNVDQNIGKYIQVGATMTASRSRRSNPMLGGVSLLPTAPVYNEDGSFFSYNQVSGNVYDNPVAQREYQQNRTRTWRGMGNVYAQLTLLKDFVLKTSFGFDSQNSKQNVYYSLNLPSRVFNKTGGYAYVGTSFPMTYQNENTISWHHTYGNHFISALGGYTWQRFKNETLSGSASGFTNDVSEFNAIQTGTPTTRDIQTSESSWGLKSYLFRANYSYKDRYMLTVSGRYDGSSRLSEGNKWTFFPSAALAWRASEEQFIKDLGVFSNLKIRLSYGTSGSQSIDPYSIIDKLASGSTVIGNTEVITFSPASSANKNLSWEKTKQIDLGFEAGFFNNRLSFEFDYYHKKTTDLLLSRELPYQTGYTSILENVGSLKNDGFELAINSVNVKSKDFMWTSNLSISRNKNKILNLGGKDFIENGIASRLIVGESIGSFWGIKYLGTWKENEIAGTTHKAGDPKLEDLDGNGLINIYDGQVMGNSEPKFYGGLGNDFTYKHLTLSMFFDFSYGNKIYDLSGRSMETGFNTNVYGRNRDRWTENNPNAYLPRAGSAFTNLFDTYAGGETTGGCSLYMHNGNYLRLKNINLQYDVPLPNREVIKGLQVYGTISNLFTLTNYFGYSPDVSYYSDATHRGFDSNSYPQSRTFLIGLKVQF